MYPYIMLDGFKLYMTGIGIVISILFFIFLIKFYTKRFGLNFWKFFNWLPVFLLLTYFLGSYSYYLIEYKVIIPFSIEDVIRIVSPYGYRFHFIGLSMGLALAVYMFLNSIKIRQEKLKRLDVFFYSISLSLVPLGFFLTLGDNFIGQQTGSSLGVSAFMEDSQLYKFSKVHPVGMYMSFVGVFAFFVTFFTNYIIRKYGIGVFGFILLLLMINIVFLFQKYPRHLVVGAGDFTFDIKNYWTLFLSFILLIYYFKLLITDRAGK